MKLQDYFLDILTSSLRSHNYSARKKRDHVAIGVKDFELRCAWAQHVDHGNVQMVSVGVEVSSRSLRMRMQESQVGLGATVEAATASAAQVWQHGQFEVLADAFGQPPAEPAFVLSATRLVSQQVVTWALYESPLQLRGRDADSLAAELENPPLLVRLQQPILNLLAPEQHVVHWIKLFGAQQPSGQFEIECTFDNAPWQEGAAVIRALPWPQSSSLVAVRSYVILKPV